VLAEKVATESRLFSVSVVSVVVDAETLEPVAKLVVLFVYVSVVLTSVSVTSVSVVLACNRRRTAPVVEVIVVSVVVEVVRVFVEGVLVRVEIVLVAVTLEVVVPSS
jgi:hypothetical protein